MYYLLRTFPSIREDNRYDVYITVTSQCNYYCSLSHHSLYVILEKFIIICNMLNFIPKNLRQNSVSLITYGRTDRQNKCHFFCSNTCALLMDRSPHVNFKSFCLVITQYQQATEASRIISRLHAGLYEMYFVLLITFTFTLQFVNVLRKRNGI